MKVVILCGGMGIRAFPFTTYLPKPMLPLGGSPVLMHLIRSFIEQGFDDFILAAGYRHSVIADYFEGKVLDARVRIVDTGGDADTGSRIYRCREFIDGPFIATYGDGLCDVPLHDVIAFHRGHGGTATVTTVPLYSQYGIIHTGDGGRITSLQEKPLIDDHWVNVGFMVFEPQVFDDWAGDNLEKDVLPALVKDGRAYAYQHRGFFKSFDSYKDVMDIDEQLNSGGPMPWAVRKVERA
jgi:glucose-1-phosphate cytidylyltransferase